LISHVDQVGGRIDALLLLGPALDANDQAVKVDPWKQSELQSGVLTNT
jgi:hypothetical protein